MAKATKKETPEKESKSFGSVATERTKRDQAIEELGRKLIRDLDDRDITAKWMASYLSEQMVASEDDATLKQETADLILKLWRERRHYPGGDPMQRYEKALSAMEFQLSTGEPVFQVWLPYASSSQPDEDEIDLARKLKHHTGGLTAMLVKAAMAELELDQDQLAEIADIADPDAETRFLSTLRIVLYEEQKEEDQNDQYSEIREAISDLRLVLDKLEAVIQGKVEDSKRIN